MAAEIPRRDDGMIVWPCTCEMRIDGNGHATHAGCKQHKDGDLTGLHVKAALMESWAEMGLGANWAGAAVALREHMAQAG